MGERSGQGLFCGQSDSEHRIRAREETEVERMVREIAVVGFGEGRGWSEEASGEVACR